jgi:hypothetical protein
MLLRNSLAVIDLQILESQVGGGRLGFTKILNYESI